MSVTGLLRGNGEKTKAKLKDCVKQRLLEKRLNTRMEFATVWSDAYEPGMKSILFNIISML